jgi:hypothetical protein
MGEYYLSNDVYEFPTPPIEGWMDNKELTFLYNFAKISRSVVEVGSWKGRSTHALLSGCKGQVFAVDHFKGSASQVGLMHKEAVENNIYTDFMKNVGHFPNLVVLKEDSCIAAKRFPKHSMDLVFIDGEHDYEGVKGDIQNWWPISRKFIVGHDLYQQGVMLALEHLKVPYTPLGTELGLWYAHV